MEAFCGNSDKFWDEKVTWNTSNPDFTPCFQKTALVWMPCGLLWLFAPVEFYLQVRNKEKRLSWTGLTIFKIFLSSCLVALSFADMIHDLLLYASDSTINSADYYAAFIKAITYILVIIMVYTGRLRGQRTSGIQFIFWLLTFLCELITFRSVLLRLFYEDAFFSQLHYVHNFVIISCTFPIVSGQLFMTAFADGDSYSKKSKNCPENTSSFLSQVTFWWFNSMVILGRKKPLTLDNMWRLSKTNSSQEIVRNFKRFWRPKLTTEYQSGTVAIVSSSDPLKRDKKTRNVFIPILRTFRKEILASGLFEFVACLITFANPVLLDLLIQFVSGNEPSWRGFLYASLIFVVSMTQSIFNGQREYWTMRISMKVRSCLTYALFKKTLLLSSTARRDYTVGEIVNLMAVDTQRVMDMMHMFLFEA